jgi:hypothetical protein
MDFIEDRDNPQRLLCMTGAAGSGKSALEQTVAERCGKSGILLAAYFFSVADPTRNTLATIVPTISLQLGLYNPDLRPFITTAVSADSFIFERSLITQMDALIVGPLRQYLEPKSTGFPYAILIDGLDECEGEDLQAELLKAIDLCLLSEDMPFRIFLASRPEMAIRTALDPGGHLYGVANHLPLSDRYNAAQDMRLYLRKRFQDLSRRVGRPQWFTESDINTLVEAASGQFVYVSTAHKYISEPRSSPEARLRIVLTWTPHEGQVARPFEALDRLYTNILLNAKEKYEAVDTHRAHDFLVLFQIYRMNFSSNLWGGRAGVDGDIPVLNSLLNLESNALEFLISDLHSLVYLENGLRLHAYHKSFFDFLDEKRRSEDLFVPEARAYAQLAKSSMQHIINCPAELNSRTQSDLILW